jgi:hypothetical protein
MNSPLTDTESGLPSELVDLSATSLSELRALDNAAISRSLRHVKAQIEYVGVTEVNCAGSYVKGD